MFELDDDKYFFEFSDKNAPVLTVKPGDTVRIHTRDCFSNQLQPPAGNIGALDWDNINPATGPIFIEGAKPGNVLKVKIESIDFAASACMCTGEAEGVMGDIFTDGLTNVFRPVVDGKLIWSDKIVLEPRPMIGVIGVAPADGAAINCGTPGAHGGNMDNTMVAPGATLYFPVAVDGALFGCGDMHAVMGDGEIGVSGGEIAGWPTLTFDVLTDRSITSPVLENDESFSTIASAPTLDEACTIAVHDMVTIIKAFAADCPPDDELVMLLSLCGNVEVCQIVDPMKTARFVVPKYVLAGLGFAW